MKCVACIGIVLFSIVLACGRQIMAETLSVTGHVVPSMETTLVSRVTGDVAQLAVSMSDKVARGDLLIKWDSLPAEHMVRESKARLAGYKADVRAAEVQLKMANVAEQSAKLNLEHLVRLVAKEKEATDNSDRELQLTLAKARLEVALAGLRRHLAEAQLERQLAQVQVAQGRLAIAEIELAQTRVIAPFDGVVAKVHFRPGSTFIAQGSPLIDIMDPSPVVEVDLPAAQTERLISRTVTVVIPVPKPSRKCAGKLVSLAPRVDRETQTIRARIIPEVPEDVTWSLMPGLLVKVTLELRD